MALSILGRFKVDGVCLEVDHVVFGAHAPTLKGRKMEKRKITS
jgi:hypothetical protein